MEQSRKHLKITSVVVLIFATLTLLNLAANIWLGGDFNNSVIPDGAPENILQITKVFLLTFSGLLLLPQIYVGMKGLCIAKNPVSSKGHIVWATILFVLTALSLLSPIVGIVKQEAVSENISTLLGILVELAVYFDYIKYAKLVSKK